MIVRIVKMTFRTEETDKFQQIFEKRKLQIRASEGCQFLELYRDKNQDNIFFTYSYWENEDALNAYRHSDLFKLVWPETKSLFEKPAEAWSVEKLVSLE
ncbi:MAG TPA: antibiotic biosynthesis monooxygenase family protein [Salinimicrobium sp.]|nr:antibiotic biosynthesis monooxygenase family protein [Salinimicrobium sp.]